MPETGRSFMSRRKIYRFLESRYRHEIDVSFGDKPRNPQFSAVDAEGLGESRPGGSMVHYSGAGTAWGISVKSDRRQYQKPRAKGWAGQLTEQGTVWSNETCVAMASAGSREH